MLNITRLKSIRLFLCAYTAVSFILLPTSHAEENTASEKTTQNPVKATDKTPEVKTTPSTKTLSEVAKVELVKIDYDNNAQEVESSEKAAEQMDEEAKEQQLKAHQQLTVSAEKKQQARQERLELERQNIQALEKEIKIKKKQFNVNLKEYLKSKCRLNDYKKGEFIHLTPELACIERNQVGVEFGPQYYHFAQSGDLGGLASGSASANLLQVSSHHGLFKDVGVETFLGIRSLALTTEGTSSITEMFYNGGVNAYYKKYFFGLHVSQTPIMRYRSATVAEWSKIGNTEVLAGYRHVTRPLFFLGEYNYSHFKLFVGIPISQSPASGITTDKTSGFSFLAEGVTTRSFLKDNMRLGFKYYLKYQSLNFESSWRGNEGSVSQTHSILGLSVFYQYDF